MPPEHRHIHRKKENILKILLLSFTVSLFPFLSFFPDIYKSNAILSPAESLQGNIQMKSPHYLF